MLWISMDGGLMKPDDLIEESGHEGERAVARKSYDQIMEVCLAFGKLDRVDQSLSTVLQTATQLRHILLIPVGCQESSERRFECHTPLPHVFQGGLIKLEKYADGATCGHLIW